jgi:hypothetical protein
VGKYVRNNCHLAANFGINSRVVFLGGIGLFFLWLERCGVVLSFFISSLSSISSYIDDMAYIKIRWSETYGWFSQPRGRSVCVPLLLYGVIDYLLRLTGIFQLMGSAM